MIEAVWIVALVLAALGLAALLTAAWYGDTEDVSATALDVVNVMGGGIGVCRSLLADVLRLGMLVSDGDVVG